MPRHPLTNFEIQKYCQKTPKFKSVYSINTLPKIKGGLYIRNLDDYESVGTYWIAVLVSDDNVEYFHSFGVEYFLSKENKKLLVKNISQQIFTEHKQIIQECNV